MFPIGARALLVRVLVRIESSRLSVGLNTIQSWRVAEDGHRPGGQARASLDQPSEVSVV